ncbi:MAG: TIGR01777 family oxidoreductase [Firmicutes bacterium]|nr:TIGR01777 family oxidoreductase [Bacillota bacterium]
MKAVVVGATGFIGVALCHYLKQCGWEVTVLARNASKAEKVLGVGYNIISWSPDSDIPQEALQDSDAVINLAGEPIGNGRWTRERKQRILESRVQTTKKLVEAIKGLDKRPEVLINASAVGYYGPRGDETLCEKERHGSDFLAEVCKKWEEEALKARRLRVRVVPVRIGIVLGRGGALKRMLTPYKLFAGGRIGNGKQWMSWIHRDDLVGIIKFVAEDGSINGPVNATAPRPVTMNEFSRVLGRVMHRPSWLPLPGIIVRMGLGEMSDMVLKGQRVLPCKLMEAGYEFKFESLVDALRDVLRKRKDKKPAPEAIATKKESVSLSSGIDTGDNSKTSEGKTSSATSRQRKSDSAKKTVKSKSHAADKKLAKSSQKSPKTTASSKRASQAKTKNNAGTNGSSETVVAARNGKSGKISNSASRASKHTKPNGVKVSASGTKTSTPGKANGNARNNGSGKLAKSAAQANSNGLSKTKSKTSTNGSRSAVKANSAKASMQTNGAGKTVADTNGASSTSGAGKSASKAK